MDISEVERMDWRNDQEFVAASHKMQRLRTRGEEIEQRMSELRQLVADHEQELVQVRASILLSESPEGADDPIQHQLVGCREELGRLAVEAAPIASAVTKLQQTLKDIERQAKVRMARPVEATIRATVQALAACLDHAAELNSELHRLHRHCQKQDLKSAMAGTPSFRLFHADPAWCFLSQPSGEPSQELRTWRRHVETMLPD